MTKLNEVCDEVEMDLIAKKKTARVRSIEKRGGWLTSTETTTTNSFPFMARLCPSIPLHAAFGAGEYAELDLLQTLERGLSNAYTLFHSVDWSTGTEAKEQHGEIDIVVVNQAGDVLLMEVKSGNVDFQSGGIFKTYGSHATAHTKDITAQIGLQYSALRSRLQGADLPVHLSHLLVLPDLRVQTQTVQWPQSRLPLLQPGTGRPHGAGCPGADAR